MAHVIVHQILVLYSVLINAIEYLWRIAGVKWAYGHGLHGVCRVLMMTINRGIIRSIYQKANSGLLARNGQAIALW